MQNSIIDIERIIEKEIGIKNSTITEVGNRELGRHSVYKIKVNNRIYILKIYGIEGKSVREINSLKILEKSDVKTPQIIKVGEKDKKKWILIEYIEGVVLEKVLEEIDYENRLTLFEEMGEELGKLHKYKIFDYALKWDESIKSNDYIEYKIEKMEERIKEIENQKLPDEKVLFKAIKIIRENYIELFSDTVFRLTHNDFDGRNILVKESKGIYNISAIIDFEQSYPDNNENDLANLYFKYFTQNRDYEKVFLDGYKKYMRVDESFYKKLRVYLMIMGIEHCSWSYEKAHKYYSENIEFLKKLLEKKIK
ncbi:aminoglycoside phosphotransferase family protein [uncultured Clostridium sp.]|uniref:phosphotransferase n=1 Tax=uncultured Clostridium sp. TaxID=59620 RepID=UPI002612E197|nr:aminoglycoside phosphotransferase family protein [uncultured Clostridium sp.]